MSGRVRPARRRRPELSQHFLSPAAAARLVQGTAITNADLVVEIGAGRGALTKPLSRAARRVIAVEIDPYLAKALHDQVGDRVTVARADFLDYRLPGEPYVVVGNVPYAHTTDIVRKLTEDPLPPHDAWLVVQRELAQRLCGRPFQNESLWSLRLKPGWHLEIVDHLERREFTPPPSVDSVFLHLRHRGRALVDAQALPDFLELIESGFAANAPLRHVLRSRMSKLQLRRLASDYRFSVDDPPQALAFEQWLAVFRFCRKLVRDGARPAPMP